MSLIVPTAAKRDFALAKAYLCRDRSERALFTKAATLQRDIHVRIDHHGDDRFDPVTSTISWDPYSALRTTRGGHQSPALGLGHELAHAVQDPAREERLTSRNAGAYDTAEERRVIRGSEAHAAQTLGESVRFDHRGFLYRVATPVSR